jgi:hypothetical protein
MRAGGSWRSMFVRAEKKRKLQSRGWKVGSTEDFLGLDEFENLYLDLHFALCEALKKTRLRKALTQTELARALGSSQSRVAKMEAGEAGVSIDLLLRSLLALGVTRRQLARIVCGSRTKSAA